MARVQEAVKQQEPFFARPVVGSTFTILSGLSFLFLMMILPLVGKAGTVVPNADKNHKGFLVALLVSLAMGVLATISKLERRKIDGSPLPLFSFILTALSSLLLVAFSLGLLRI
ncbi:MAG: hypothetical protein V1929_09625 [bacterium]